MSLFVFLVSSMLLSSARDCGVQSKLFSMFSWKHNNSGKGKIVEEMCNLCTWASSVLTALWICSSKTVSQNNCSVKKLPYNLSKYEFAKKIVMQLSQWVNNNADLRNEVQYNMKDGSFINQNLIIFSSSKTLLMPFLKDSFRYFGLEKTSKGTSRTKSHHKSRKGENYLSILRLSQIYFLEM